MLFFFFFKQKTAYEMRISDWSSDVCSSDLAVTSNDIARNGSGALEVVGCAGCHLIHEDFFGDASPEQHGNGVQQAFFVHAVAVAFGQLHGYTQRTTTRNDGDLVDGISLGQHARHQSVA